MRRVGLEGAQVPSLVAKRGFHRHGAGGEQLSAARNEQLAGHVVGTAPMNVTDHGAATIDFPLQIRLTSPLPCIGLFVCGFIRYALPICGIALQPNLIPPRIPAQGARRQKRVRK